MGQIPMDFAKGEESRNAILKSAIAERKRHPKEDYSVLAKQLNAAKDKKVAWCKLVIQPVAGCGEYSIRGQNGILSIADTCGSSELDGWPPKNLDEIQPSSGMNSAD
jgi:hypothetical protein